MDNVFPDFASLTAAAHAVQGPKIVIIDDAILPAEVPAGTWDLGPGTELRGNPQAGNPVTALTGTPGAVILGVSSLRDLAVVAQGPNALLPLAPRAGGLAFFLFGSASLQATGAGAALELSGPGLLVPKLYDTASLLHGTGAAVHVPAGSQLQIVLFDTSLVEGDSLVVDAGSPFPGVQLASAAAFAEPLQPRVPGGVLHVDPGELASGVQYSNGSPSSWAGGQGIPKELQSATDRLAAAVAGLLGHPIP